MVQRLFKRKTREYIETSQIDHAKTEVVNYAKFLVLNCSYFIYDICKITVVQHWKFRKKITAVQH